MPTVLEELRFGARGLSPALQAPRRGETRRQGLRGGGKSWDTKGLMKCRYGTSQTGEDLHHHLKQCFYFTAKETKAQGQALGYLFLKEKVILVVLLELSSATSGHSYSPRSIRPLSFL